MTRQQKQDSKKLLLAFEYGVILSQVAKEKGVDVTPALVKRCEEIIEKEFEKNGPTKLAVDMTVNILAAFEV